MKYLLDTNVLIALRNAVQGRHPKDPGRADQLRRIQERTQGIPAADLAMSMISLGELRVWAERHADRAKAEAAMTQLLARVQCVGPDAGDPSGSQVARQYGEVRASLEQSGQTIGNNDLWIAAHALALGATLVTNNTREFSRVPALVVEDWSA